jgi:hypothetical protein
MKKAGLDEQEFTPKVVGRRHSPSDSLRIAPADRPEDARAWKAALRELPIRKGIYRFRTHEEANEWLWQRLTSRP